MRHTKSCGDGRASQRAVEGWVDQVAPADGQMTDRSCNAATAPLFFACLEANDSIEYAVKAVIFARPAPQKGDITLTQYVEVLGRIAPCGLYKVRRWVVAGVEAVVN